MKPFRLKLRSECRHFTATAMRSRGISLLRGEIYFTEFMMDAIGMTFPGMRPKRWPERLRSLLLRAAGFAEISHIELPRPMPRPFSRRYHRYPSCGACGGSCGKVCAIRCRLAEESPPYQHDEAES